MSPRVHPSAMAMGSRRWRQTVGRGALRAFTLLPDGEAVYREWRRLIVAHAVSGVQVYDARLVAVMKVHDVTHLLTLNDRDVARYAEITVVHPSQVVV